MLELIPGLLSLMFLLYYPLKQGLKQKMNPILEEIEKVFTLLSIKTRIETVTIGSRCSRRSKFLLYYPLKQGLKQKMNPILEEIEKVFTLLSIKTRIETGSIYKELLVFRICFYSTIH